MVVLFDLWLYATVLNLIGVTVTVIVLLCKRHEKKNVKPKESVQPTQPVLPTDCIAPSIPRPMPMQQTPIFAQQPPQPMQTAVPVQQIAQPQYVPVPPAEKAPSTSSKVFRVIWFVCGALAFLIMIAVTILMLSDAAGELVRLQEKFGYSVSSAVVRSARSELISFIIVLWAELNLLALWIIFARRVFTSPINFLSGIYWLVVFLAWLSEREINDGVAAIAVFYFFGYAILVLAIPDGKKKKTNEINGVNGNVGGRLTQPILPSGCIAPSGPQPLQQCAQPQIKPKRPKEPSATEKAFALIGYICGTLCFAMMTVVGIRAICETASYRDKTALLFALGFFIVLLSLFVLWIVFYRRLSVMDTQIVSILFFLIALAMLMFMEKNHIAGLITLCVMFFPYTVTLIACSGEKKKNPKP